MNLPQIPVNRVVWTPCWRILPSRYPPISLFERVADPADLDAVFYIESLTNDRLRQEVGALSLVPDADRISGPGTSYIMAAFTHLNPDGSRFSDGTFGVFYAANDLKTSIAETRYHRENFMRATKEKTMVLPMRVLLADLEGELHDIRGMQIDLEDVYNRESYSASQPVARTLRSQGSWGIVYDSVRRKHGECAAVFRPPVLSNCRQERHLGYYWDGTRISDIWEIRTIDA